MSLLTILYPEGFDCVTGRSDMICDMYAICGMLYVICAMYDMWAGRQDVMGRKAIMLWAGRRCNEGQKVRAGGRMCVRYTGELTKLRAYVVYVMLFQDLTVTRDGNGSIVHTEERVVFGRILVFYYNEK